MRPQRLALLPVLAASVALTAGFSPAEPGLARAARGGAAAAPLRVRVGESSGVTHIDFPGRTHARETRVGGDLVLFFPGAVRSPDLTRLTLEPTALVKGARVVERGGGLELRLTPADGARLIVGDVDGALTVALQPPAPVGAADQKPSSGRPSPLPASGSVPVEVIRAPGSLTLRFAWAQPLGAAVFRRGGSIFVVFDAKAAIALPKRVPASPLAQKIAILNGTNYSGVRLLAPSSSAVSASAAGGTWSVSVTSAPPPPPPPIKLARLYDTGRPELTAELAGATSVLWVADPEVGDRLAVVPALGPVKGMTTSAAVVEAKILSSAQGLALVPAADDLSVTTDGDLVRIGRPAGLALSAPSGPNREGGPVLAGLPVPALSPGLIDFDRWADLGSASFLSRYAALQERVSSERAKGKPAAAAAEMGLARFLLGSELSFEAMGVLDLAASDDPTLPPNAEFRGLRGAARAMAGRFKAAQADFSVPVLAEDPASALWRAYLAEKLGDPLGARQQFQKGRSALRLFTERWRGRFAETQAQADLEAGDLPAARGDLALAQALKLEPLDAQSAVYLQGRILEAGGQLDGALKLYDLASASPWGALAAPAELHALQIRLSRGAIGAADAEAKLDSLRFRWRGDATELEAVRALGRLYLSQGRYRQALEALRSANGRLPDLPASIGVSGDLAAVFKALFLGGQADGLQPIQALALFYDFKELTPIGADGDEMVRRLCRRLVDVDLLDQAAELLKYQADNRLDGVPRAEVSTQLALIQLMAKRPEEALNALNASRTTLLPTALNLRRRLIEARAEVELGRYDAALELLTGVKSPETDALLGEIAWRRRDWAAAAPRLEAELGERWRRSDPLTPAEQGLLVRAGVAYSLAGDDRALARLRQHFGGLAARASASAALRVALDGVEAGRLSVSDFSQAASDDAVFEGWLSDMKKAFRSEGAQPLTASLPAAKAGRGASPGAPPRPA